MELSVCRVQLLHAGPGVRTSRDPIAIPRAAPPLPGTACFSLTGSPGVFLPALGAPIFMDLSFNIESEPYLTIFEW